MENLKKAAVFFFISVIIHFYLILALYYTVDKNILNSLFGFLNRQKINKIENSEKKVESVLEDVIVETMTSSEKKPDKGKISDKSNIDSGVKGKDNNYNYLNLDPLNTKSKFNPAETTENKFQDSDINKEKNTAENNGVEITPVPDQKSARSNSANGDYHTSFFDVYKPPDVTMNSEGDLSLATIDKKYADYFFAMEKKISEKWGNFFPVFQYYQGIIKSGTVVVQFNIDSNGNITDAVVTKSYGYTIIDQSCLNAVIYAKNFGPLPEELKEKSPISINFTFSYISRQ